MIERKRGLLRHIRLVSVVGALVISIIAVGAYAYLRESLPKTTGILRVAGILSPIDIIRDEHGIPHIFANSETDAWFGLGFVHAQDRLFQMDMVRRLGEGRLAEVLGKSALGSDRLMRTLDLEGQAKATAAQLDHSASLRLEAYAAGVNAWVKALPVLPPEFIISGYTPEPWRPIDSLIWGRIMAFQLGGNWRDELIRSQLSAFMSTTQIDEIWSIAPTINAKDPAKTARQLGRPVEEDFVPWIPNHASNEWVVDGQHTSTGRPLLANDPHLPLTTPAPWYLAQISSPEVTLVGASAPGLPAIIAGHNGRVAWGLTTTNADSFDVFIERSDPQDSGRYLTPTGSLPYQLRVETIKVHGSQAVTMTVRATRHGPIISDLGFGGERSADEGLALSFPAFYRIDNTVEALFSLNHAQNWDHFVSAIQTWHAPTQNIVYADVDGNIGFASAGLVPHRKSGSGWLPQPGWSGEYDWDGFVPSGQMPRLFNPASGMIINSNDRVVSDDSSVFISKDWEAPYRARRIRELLYDAPQLGLAAAEKILTDSLSLFALELRPYLQTVVARDPQSRQALKLLAAWDGRMQRDQPEPLILTAWLRELLRSILRDEQGRVLPGLLREHPGFLLSIFQGKSAFCRDQQEGCSGVLSESLSAALKDLSNRLSGDMTRWRWGDLHYASFPHSLFTHVPVLDRALRFRVPTDGDSFTVNLALPQFANPTAPFVDFFGANYRAVYDLSDLAKSRFIVAPGQSGNPLSSHWGDLIDLWSRGELLPIATERAQLNLAADILKLTPP